MSESPPLPDAQLHVCLRLLGDFAPIEVTRRLGVVATHSYERDSPVGNGRSGRKHANAGWFLSSERHVSSTEIEPHLAWLLDACEPTGAALAALVAEGARADVDCFWSSVGMSGGPWLAPETMKRLGNLQLPLMISFYAVDGIGSSGSS